MRNTKEQIDKAILVIKHGEEAGGCAPSYGGWYYHQWDLRYVDKRGIAHLNHVARRVAKVFRRDKRGKFVYPSQMRANARLKLARLVAWYVDRGVFAFVDGF